DPGFRPRWCLCGDDLPQLELLDPGAGAADAVLEQVWRLPRGEADFVTVVVPELFRSPSVFDQARRPLELALKLRLLAEPGVVVANVPVLPDAPTQPKRLVARVIVSDANAASMRARSGARMRARCTSHSTATTRPTFAVRGPCTGRRSRSRCPRRPTATSAGRSWATSAI